MSRASRTTPIFLLTAVLGFVHPQVVFAAVPIAKKIEPSIQALELLSLPEKNREALILTQRNRDQLGQELMAFSLKEDQPMGNRWRALTLGALARGQASQPELEKALKHEQWFMRNAALVAIERLFPQQLKTAALSLLHDKALVVRSAAVKALSHRLDSASREQLWEELDQTYNFKNKQSLWVRAQILSVLAEEPEKRELPVFAKTLRDKDSRLHFYSIAALEKIANKKLGSERSSLAEKRDLWLKAKL